MKKEDLKRLLAGFFLVMFLLTVLSRGASAVTVPRVWAEGAKQGALTYRLYGEGVIEEEKMRAVEVVSGLRIAEVFAEAGEQVKKDSPLFSYTLESIHAVLEEKEKELKKLQLSYREAAGGQQTGQTEEENARLTLEQSKDTLERARQKVEEEKKRIQKEAEERVAALQEEKETLLGTWEETLLKAQQEEEDSREAYEKEGLEKSRLEAVLSGYRSAVSQENATEGYTYRQELIKEYFGTGYEEYLFQKSQASRALKNAREDLEDLRASWKEQITEADKDSDDEAVVENYKAQCRQRDGELKAAQRVIDSARSELSHIMLEETTLTEAMNRYETAGEYEVLYGLLAEKKRIDTTAIEQAEKTWNRAREELERLKEKREKEIEKLDRKIEEAQDYDDTASIEEKKQAVEDAKYAKKQATNSVKTIKNTGREAARARALQLEALNMEMQDKEKEKRKFQELLENQGQVPAPANGTVAEQELKAGGITSGQERYLLAADLCSFQARVPAGDCIQFQQGDDITLSRAQKTQTLQITSLSVEDADNMRLLTVELPKDSMFVLGSTWSFLAEKSSAGYDQRVPLEALRKDNSGYYLLLVEERQGILNTETYLRRQAVDLLAKDDTYAAINGSIGRDSQVLVSSSRNVESGDQVRLEEGTNGG